MGYIVPRPDWRAAETDPVLVALVSAKWVTQYIMHERPDDWDRSEASRQAWWSVERLHNEAIAALSAVGYPAST